MSEAGADGADADGVDALARRCADAMWRSDAASQALGMVLLDAGPGRATLRMPVTAAMCNGLGTCHGGMIFSLADTAFAFACNSRDERTVAAQCSIAFLRPAQRGQVLVAEARETARWGRNGLYDVTVRDGDAAVVAEFRGHSRAIGGAVLPPDPR